MKNMFQAVSSRPVADIFKKIEKAFAKRLTKRFTKITPPCYINRHRDEDFLILVTGPNVKKYSRKISEFIQEKKPLIIGCNNIPDIYTAYYHMFVNRSRFSNYAPGAKPASRLLLSAYFTPQHVRHIIKDTLYEKVMFKNIYPAQKGRLRISNGIIYAEGATVGILAIAAALVMGAKNVFIAGMDGYSLDKERSHYYHEKDRKAFQDLLKLEAGMKGCLADLNAIIKKSKASSLKIITPTAYKEYYDRSVLK